MMAGDDRTATILNILEHGQIDLEGLVPWGSNYTFLVHVSHESGNLDAIYKPSQGERPLWDFSRGTLCLRERAAYLTSEILGWHIVPPTVLREGPHGWGSVQYFVEHNPQLHYLTLQGQYERQVQRISLFDVLINNADRKSGHVIQDEEEQLWAIDHGVCFHADYKLRSVIWDFSGQPIPEELTVDLVSFRSWLGNGNDPNHEELSQLLDRNELDALVNRVEHIIEGGIFPHPGSGRHYPWPLV
jgi:hypothetical protein